MRARGLVGQVRHVINVKDSFTRINQEREREAQVHRAEYQQRMWVTRERQDKLEAAKRDVFALYGINDPHHRGIALENALNKLFAAYNILITENFKRKGPSGTIDEQIDGVIEMDHQMYLVEMKWWKDPIGPAELSQHVSRLIMRSEVSGIFISNSDYTPSSLDMARSFLTQRLLVLCTVREIVDVLNSDGDLMTMLRGKVRVAKLDRNPFKEIG